MFLKNLNGRDERIELWNFKLTQDLSTLKRVLGLKKASKFDLFSKISKNKNLHFWPNTPYVIFFTSFCLYGGHLVHLGFVKDFLLKEKNIFVLGVRQMLWEGVKLFLLFCFSLHEFGKSIGYLKIILVKDKKTTGGGRRTAPPSDG